MKLHFYLGVPVGHKEFTKAQLWNSKTIEIVGEDTPSVQVGWWLFMSFFKATRSNYWLRTVRPELTAEFRA